MNDAVKKFIEDNIKLIETNDWEEVYKKAKDDIGEKTGQFTKMMLEADIHPEYWLKVLPRWFLYNEDIKEFNIPGNVTSIGDLAFCGCTSLTNIVIPNNITNIASHTFYMCTSLSSIEIPDSVTSIGSSAFWGCDNLASVVIGDSVTRIRSGTFQYCKSLTSVMIPDSITSIEDWAFTNCGDKLIIDYSGTKEDWKKIYNTEAFKDMYFTVNCTDGTIVKKKR